MDDAAILQRIGELVDEEHRLTKEHENSGLEGEDRQRMEALAVALDQCWDLLRQRRARRHAGEDPDQAQTRPPEVVERYVQ
jgi:hypothetical protein